MARRDYILAGPRRGRRSPLAWSFYEHTAASSAICRDMGLVWDGTLQAFRLLLAGDPEVWRITLLSLQISGGATLLSLVVGVPCGTALALARFPGRGFIISLVNTGMGLPPVVVGLFVTILLWRNGAFGALELLYTPARHGARPVRHRGAHRHGTHAGRHPAGAREVPPPDARARRLASPDDRRAAARGPPADARRGHGGLRRRDLRGRRLDDGRAAISGGRRGS